MIFVIPSMVYLRTESQRVKASSRKNCLSVIVRSLSFGMTKRVSIFCSSFFRPVCAAYTLGLLSNENGGDTGIKSEDREE